MANFPLYPYQTDIINQTINSDESTLIQVPTGGGKTVIAKEIVKYLTNKLNKQVLFVAPQINLMEQTKEEFQELSPLIIHGKEDNTSHSVLISTLQTASRRDINPDVIIIDEVHHGFEGKMIEKLRRDNPNARIIGLSATPYDKNGKQLQGFGLVLDRYDMKYMIENNYLVNLKVEILVHIRNLDKVKINGGDYEINALGKIMCNDKTIMEIVRTTREYIWDKKTIVFAVNISHAELLTKAYQDAGFAARVIHSDLPNKNLAVEQEIQDFKDGKTKILVSVAMLTTGFNVPDTDVAVIARPTKSQNLYKQMVGRVLRTADGKTHALLLDCGNVIDELGLPLDPIREKQTKENSNSSKKCEKCGSEKISLIRKDDKFFWECKDCKHLQPIEQGSYECKICKRTYAYNEKLFSNRNNKIFLDCEDCPYPTLISEYTGQEVFISVEQKQYREVESQKSLAQKSEEKQAVELNNEEKIDEIKMKFYKKDEEAKKFEREAKNSLERSKVVKKQIQRLKKITIEINQEVERNITLLQNQVQMYIKSAEDYSLKAVKCKKEATQYKLEAKRLTALGRQNCDIKTENKVASVENIEQSKPVSK